MNGIGKGNSSPDASQGIGSRFRVEHSSHYPIHLNKLSDYI